jgi:hypothetical protein
VAQKAALSTQWRPALKTMSPRVFCPLVTAFLNEGGAYQEWNPVFEKYGLRLKVAGVEKVMLEPFSATKATCPAGANCAHLRVPADALIQINIESITSH